MLTTLSHIPLKREHLEKLKQLVSIQKKKEESKPFQVSIIGQTGVGKSSLINALFQTNLKTDPIRPCTMEIEKVVLKGKQGHELWFYDLPGIGESENADVKYLEQYRERLEASDVVLWAIHADNRSISFDFAALHQLLNAFPEAQRAELISKVTFVLTKSDMISPTPWILSKDNEMGTFVPNKEIRTILEQKSAYYQEVFLAPYASAMASRTYNDCHCMINDSQFVCDRFQVTFHGIMDQAALARFKTQYPDYQSLFNRLYENYQVIPCSSLYRYNLNKLLLVIINKLGNNAILRFRNFFESGMLDRLPIDEAKTYCNLIVVDSAKQEKLFDLTNMNF